jgi:hypothetical protein
MPCPKQRNSLQASSRNNQLKIEEGQYLNGSGGVLLLLGPRKEVGHRWFFFTAVISSRAPIRVSVTFL